MQLGHVGHIEFNFNARDQLIIGTNGCGKSSIFFELSPLPADSKQFEKTGKKEIHIQYNGMSIVATSTFDPKPFHSFVVDDVELNESGLITIQKELAEKYTRITPDTHDLLMGKVLFTSMGSNDRRQWFTRLSDANYEYLIGVYLRFKDEMRDITGALRLAKNKLVTETSKAIKDEELTSIRKDVESLYELIEHLSEKRIPIDKDIQDLKNKREHLLNQIDVMNEGVVKVFKYLNKNTNYNPATIQEDIINIVGDIRVFKAREEEFFIKHKEQTEIFEILEKTKLESVAKLSTDIDIIRREIETIKSEKSFPFVNGNPESALSSIAAITSDVQEIVSNIDKNPDRGIYNRTTFEQVTTNIQHRQNEIRSVESNIAKYEAVLAHHKEHEHEGHLTCPKCEHSWNRGLSLENKIHLDQNIKDLHIKKADLEAELKTLQEDAERFRIYSDYLKSYRAIVNHTRDLSDFWDHVSDQHLLNLKPSAISNLLVSYEADVKKDLKIKSLNVELLEKLKLLELTNESKDHDYATVKKTLEDLDNKIHVNIVSLTQAFSKQDELNKFNSAVTFLETRKKALEDAIANLDTNTADVMENYRRQAYNAILRNLQSILATKERVLHESVTQVNLIKNLELEIATLTDKEKAMKAGLKVLSPTEGLIAKGLYGFMQIFIRNMNAVIAKIWSYPLVIKPCNVGDDGSIDLNYKFPMVVNGHEGGHKDVSEGSSAMIEVVDIAFRICAMKALKMGDFPLFLDEFGKTMDSVHRRATTSLINSLMEEDSFSQMFLISHDISQYGALTNCEVCVLNDMNVILPPNSVYNKHVVLY